MHATLFKAFRAWKAQPMQLGVVLAVGEHVKNDLAINTLSGAAHCAAHARCHVHPRERTCEICTTTTLYTNTHIRPHKKWLGTLEFHKLHWWKAAIMASQ